MKRFLQHLAAFGAVLLCAIASPAQAVTPEEMREQARLQDEAEATQQAEITRAQQVIDAAPSSGPRHWAAEIEARRIRAQADADYNEAAATEFPDYLQYLEANNAVAEPPSVAEVTPEERGETDAESARLAATPRASTDGQEGPLAAQNQAVNALSGDWSLDFTCPYSTPGHNMELTVSEVDVSRGTFAVRDSRGRRTTEPGHFSATDITWTLVGGGIFGNARSAFRARRTSLTTMEGELQLTSQPCRFTATKR